MYSEFQTDQKSPIWEEKQFALAVRGGESKLGTEWYQRLICYQRRDLQNVSVVGNGWAVNSRETEEALLCVKVV